MAVKWRFGWVCLGFSIVALLVYAQGLPGSWLFDDRPNLVDNAALQIDPTVFDQWRTAALSSGSGILRRPLAMFSFTLNAVLPTGLTPAALKATNILIHLATAAVLFGFFASLMRSLYGRSGFSAAACRGIAFFATAIWLLHPIHVSTVLYSVQRMAQMSTFFILCGLWLFTWYRSSWARYGAEAGEILAALLWLSLFLMLASLSKENGILLAWLVLVVEVCVFRGSWNGSRIPWLERFSWVALAIPALVLLFVIILAPDWLVSRYGSRDFTMGERLMTQGRLLWQYLGWLAWPEASALAVHHDDIRISRGMFDPVSTLVSLIAWPVSIYAAMWIFPRAPLLLFGLLFYLVGHSIESTAWPLMMVFEHRNYLSSVGFCLLIAWGLYSLARKSGQVNPLVPGIGLVVVLCALLFVRTSVWSDEIRLSEVNVRHHPDSPRSHYIHGNNLLRLYQGIDQGERDSAEARDLLVAARYHFEIALELAPDDIGALVTLYQLDSNYFAALNTKEAWLEGINELVSKEGINRQDIAALQGLMRCLGAKTCPGGEAVQKRVLAVLSERFSKSTHIPRLQHLYMQAKGLDASSRVAMLEVYLQSSPNNVSLLQRALIDYVAMGEMGQAYEMGRRMLKSDDGRWYTSLLKNAFPGVARLKLDTP